MKRPTALARLRTVALAAMLAVTAVGITALPDGDGRPPDPAAGLAGGLARLLRPQVAEASFCADNPGFTGRLTASSASTTAVTRITDPDVFGYLSNVDDDWSCTAYYRYSGVAWNTEAAKGRFDWGNLIESTSVSCNYFVGTTDYVKGNPTNDCPDSDAEYALEMTLSKERVYQNDNNHDSEGDLSFVHSDCGTLYGGGDGEALSGTEANPVSFSAGTVANRPGSNCDPLTIDGTGTTQTITYDATPPTVAFSFPTAGGPTVVPSAFAGVTFDGTDTVAGFGGTNDWDLQRQKGTWNGTRCTGFANDTGTNALVSGTTQGAGQVSSQSLAVGSCYQWTLSATDQNGNTATTITSGSIRIDTSGVWGDQPQFRMETWDLGAGDTLSVSTGSGNLRLSHPIVGLPIQGGSLDLVASYNSQDPATIGLGPGWRLNVQRRLTVGPNGDVAFTDGDGARHTFTNPQGSGTLTYTRPATLYATLVRDTLATPDRFTLTYRDQSKDVFDEDIAGTGLLKQIQDRYGNTVVLAYTSGTAKITTITDPAGRTIAFTWDGSGRLTQIVDWANVSGGIVQSSGTGNRTHRFFYDGSGNLAGWADPLNTSGSCPTNASHLTCLSYTAGLLSAIARWQTYETISGNPGNLSTANRTLTTSIAYMNADVASVTDAASVQTTFSHPAVVGQTKVVRPGTPASETTYTLLSQTDALGRTSSVKRKLGGAQIETETTYDASYPIEPASVMENKGGGALERVTNYTYLTNTLGLLSRLDEPLDGTYRRWTDLTYNANNDVTQQVVSRSGDAATDTVTRYCYTTSGCSTPATDLFLRAIIGNYVDGTKGGSTGNVEDVTTDYQYDANGQRIRETRSNYQAGGTLLDSRANGFTYDANGNLTSEIANYVDGTVTNPGDDITPNGTTNARNDLTTADGYDTAGNRVSTADPRRAIEQAKGTSLGADDYIARTLYDALNQPTIERLPSSISLGIADCSPSPACRESTTAYDELGLVREATDNPGVLRATKYDAVGRALESYEDPPPAGGAAITSIMTYDGQGRVLTTKDRRQAATASLGLTLTAYDELGRVTQITDASGSSPDLAAITTTSWDALDRKTAQTIGSGTPSAQTTIWTYDIGGRATKTDDEFTCTTTTYDYRNLALTVVEGQASGACSGSGLRTIANTPDGLGRITQSAVTAGQGNGDILAAGTFDSGGNQLSTSATTAGVTTSSTFTVNPLDQVIAETKGSTSWTKTNFDPAGNPTDRCVWNAVPPESCKPADQTFNPPQPAVKATSAYDARNQRISLKLPSVGETTYDPAHDYQVAAVYVSTGSGQEHQTIYGYDSRHRLTSMTQQLCTISTGHSCSATVPTASDAYAYDDNDNRTQVVESEDGGATTTWNYCYDALNFLRARNTTSACTITSGDETYLFDDPGNRTRTVIAGVTTDFAYDPEGQLCKVGATTCGTPNVTYDTAGRTATWNGWNLTYDGEGRLSTACKVSGCATGDKVTMAYDGEGRRIELVTRPNGGATTTTTFRYQGEAIAQDVNTTTGLAIREYVTDESGRIVKICDPTCASPTTSYLVTWNGHGDALGLWRINADGSLTLANSYTYSTWGAPTTTVASGFTDLGFRYLYVGAQDVQWDNAFGLGLLYMHARHYSPALGRFAQPDPLGVELNPYAYVANNCISSADATGTSWRRLSEPGCESLFSQLVRVYRDLRHHFAAQKAGRLSEAKGHAREIKQLQQVLGDIIARWDHNNCGPRTGLRLPAAARAAISLKVPRPSANAAEWNQILKVLAALELAVRGASRAVARAGGGGGGGYLMLGGGGIRFAR